MSKAPDAVTSTHAPEPKYSVRVNQGHFSDAPRHYCVQDADGNHLAQEVTKEDANPFAACLNGFAGISIADVEVGPVGPAKGDSTPIEPSPLS